MPTLDLIIIVKPCLFYSRQERRLGEGRAVLLVRAEARQVRAAGKGDAGQAGPGHQVLQPQLVHSVTTTAAATTTAEHHVYVDEQPGYEEEHQPRY